MSRLSGKPKAEVKCPVGRIDILTDTQIIECKHYGSINNFKHALGQVMAYSFYHQSKTKVLALIGKPRIQEQCVAEEVAKFYNVEVWWLDGSEVDSCGLLKIKE
jgi:hypothetical protein